MADFFSSKTFGAGNSFIEGQINKQLRDIDNPAIRRGLGSMLNAFLPGFGNSDYGNNAYEKLVSDAVLKRQGRTSAEQANIINQAVTGGADSLVSDQSSDVLKKKYDWRARLRPKEGGKEKFYSAVVGSDDGSDSLLRPIQESNGLVWQYTPTIFLSGTAEYDQKLMQGMNYPINTFISGRAPDIPVTADFTANDAYEARYLLAVMTFLRVCTKAYFGDAAVANGDYGTPPPVLIFEYLGDHGFNKVPVVVSNYQMQLPDDVDYVPVQVGDTVTYVPTRTNITVNLMPTYTPHKLRRRFDLDALANGKLYSDGFI